MNRIFAKALVVLFGVAFIAGGLAAIFIYHKTVAGALILAFAGMQLLRRKTFGLYTVLFLAVVMGAMGLFLAGIAVNDLRHHMNNMTMLWIGLTPVFLAVVTVYCFTRRAMAEEFGLERIRLIEKIDRAQLVATGKTLLWIVIVLGMVMIACWGVARHIGGG